MSTRRDFVDFIEDQLGELDIRTGAMFGEFAIYCDEKVVGFICDDVLLIKPSTADASLFERTTPGQPYPGSKFYHAVPGDALEDREWLQLVVQSTADVLPAPKPKQLKQKRPKAPR